MGQTFSSNNRECFGLGAEIKKPGDDDSKEAQEARENNTATENDYPPGHPLYKPKAFKPATATATASPPIAHETDAFRPFISPRYHLHLNLNVNDPVPYGAEGAFLEPCEQCIRMKRSPPTMVETDVCMCKPCWDEGTEDMRHVVRHRNNHHKTCPKDYPPSELQHLPDNSADVIAHWRAEWRHSHDDHELCRPHYLFGCTAVEILQLQQLRAHQEGNHANCPKEFPIYMLKPSVQDEAPHGEDEDELGEDTKEAWRSSWCHEHGDHSLCRAEHGFGCNKGEPVELEHAQNGLHAEEGAPAAAMSNGVNHSHIESSTTIPSVAPSSATSLP